MHRLIDICVCTYKRPEQLRACLQSLLNQTLIGVRLRIIVVDNDAEESAKTICINTPTQKNIELSYFCEKRRGISFARNKCIDKVRGEYFCFIDDDERASAEWVHFLLMTAEQSGADIVAGPVLVSYPNDTPRWVIRSRVFERRRKVTGEPVDTAGTGNCMIRTTVLANIGMPFNPKYALSGGEDSDFFHRLILSGCLAVFCNEAEVTEEADRSRMTVGYLMRRAFRGGQTHAMIHYPGINRVKLGLIIVKKMAHISIGLAMTSLTFPFGKARYARWLLKTASSYGQLSGLSGKLSDIYTDG